MYGHARFMPPVNGDSAVDDDQLAVVPQVGPAAKRDVKHRHEEGNLAAGLDQRSQEPPSDPPRTDVVDQQANRHAFRRPARQAVDQGLAPLVTAQDVGRDVDRRPRLLDQPHRCAR